MTHDGSMASETVAFSPDGKLVVSGAGTTAHVWETTTGKEIANMKPDTGVSSVTFNPDGKFVVSSDRNITNGKYIIRVWETGTGKEITQMMHDDLVGPIAFSPDGKYVVSGSWDKT